MIYKVDLPNEPPVYVISSGHVWIPGRYEDERAARYAFRFSNASLQALQDSVNPGGIITFAMLQALRKARATTPTSEEP